MRGFFHVLAVAITLSLFPTDATAQLLGTKCAVDVHEDLREIHQGTVRCCRDALLQIKEAERKTLKTMCRGIFWFTLTEIELDPASNSCNTEINYMIANTISDTDELECDIS